MGFHCRSGTAKPQGTFTVGTLNQLMDNVNCTGVLTSITDCAYDPTPNCLRSEDVGVECS